LAGESAGIEAEAAMLGQPISMLYFRKSLVSKLRGKLKPSATATDLVLTVTQMLRKEGRRLGSLLNSLVLDFLLSQLQIARLLRIWAPEYGANNRFLPC